MFLTLHNLIKQQSKDSRITAESIITKCITTNPIQGKMDKKKISPKNQKQIHRKVMHKQK